MDDVESPEAIAEFKALMADPAARQAFVDLKRTRARDYEHVFRAVFATPWAILDEYMPIIAERLVEHYAGMRLDAEELAARLEAARRTRTPAQAPPGVAVIPIQGVIVPKGGMLSEVSGATSIATFRESLRTALAAEDVSGIVLDIDSPGGNVAQVPEMAQEIRAARGRKPIVAAVSGMGASAAYWLASQADEIVVTRSGLVGSIGVVTAHKDMSVAAEKLGVKTSLISAGKFKTEGNPFEPLTDEARAHAQSLVDEAYGQFVSDVAKGRGVPVATVREGFGEGRVVSAKDAVAQGMADRVGTVEEAVGGILAGQVASRAAVYVGATTTIGAALEWDGSHLAEGMADAWEHEAAELTAAVDRSAWDGNRALGACNTASDYRSICAGERTTGEPDQRQHWALPHHYLGRGPNADGVRNALSRLPQTQGLRNREEAQSHLDAHMREINPERSSDADIASLREDPVPSPLLG